MNTTPMKTQGVDISPEAVERSALYLGVAADGADDFKGWLAEKAAEQLRALRTALTAEAKRLDWLMPRVPGAVYRAHGVAYSAGPDRAAIDAAMEKANG